MTFVAIAGGLLVLAMIVALWPSKRRRRRRRGKRARTREVIHLDPEATAHQAGNPTSELSTTSAPAVRSSSASWGPVVTATATASASRAASMSRGVSPTYTDAPHSRSVSALPGPYRHPNTSSTAKPT